MWGLWREVIIIRCSSVIKDLFTRFAYQQNFPKHDVALIKKYGKTFGYFDGQLPNLWTTDAELIRSVFVKDFDHFVNRRVSQLFLLKNI